MALKIDEITMLQEYIENVISRANHHAKNVSEIVLTLIGAIIWKKDSESILVRGRNKDMKNVLWVSIGSKKYAFSYNHDNYQIDMRKDKINGETIHSFDNNTDIKKIIEIFSSLAKQN